MTNWKRLSEVILTVATETVIGHDVLSSVTKVRDGIADEEDKALTKAFYNKINKRQLTQVDAKIKKLNTEKLLLLQNKLK